MVESLGGLDALFLHLETAAMPMHVASLHVYRRPPGVEGDLLAHLRAHLASRLHLSPVFTRRMASTPLGLASPAWVHEADVDMEYHLRRETLPAPGSRRELERCAARLHSELLDRSKPLWQFTLIEGLDRPDIFGFYAKVHHAAIDGKAGVAFAQALLDVTEVPRDVAPPDPARAQDDAGGSVELLQVALSNQLRQSRRLLRMLPDLVKAGSSVAGAAIGDRVRAIRRRRAEGSDNESGVLGTGPRTPLNVTIDGDRTFATAEARVDDVKAITAVLGGTINDAVLMLCSSALRGLLLDLGALPDEPLVAAVPVSLRAEGDAASNTQATMFRVPLATHVADPLGRWHAILEATARMKHDVAAYRSAIPADFPSIGVPWLLPGLAELYGRSGIADVIRPPANLVISNVPGPRVPLYFAGARMLTYWPMSIVVHGLGLNVTCETYHDAIYFGVVASRKAVPDAERLADRLRAALVELGALASRERPGGDAPRPRRAHGARAT